MAPCIMREVENTDVTFCRSFFFRDVAEKSKIYTDKKNK